MTKITIPNKYLVLALLGAVLAILALGWYLGRQNGINSTTPLVSGLNGQIAQYEATIADQRAYITQAEQEIATQKEALKELGWKNADLKALNIKQANEITSLKLRVDTLLKNVGHGGQIITIRDTVYQMPQNAILLPFDFSKKDNWLDLKGSFSSQGILDISLGMRVDVDVVTGYVNKGKQQIVTVLVTDNPYVKTVGVRSFKTDIPRPKKYGVGVFVGYGINTRNPMEPAIVVGAGLSYNIIRL